MFRPHLLLAKKLWQSFVRPGDLAIDATVGNGHDAYFLLELGAEVIGLDVQASALEATKAKTHGKKIKLFQHSHAELSSLELPRSPRLIVYNLGYLPGSDKQITTQVSSTLKSVSQGLDLLEPKGALCITCYPGHDEGLEEEKALIEWASQLDPQKWEVCHYKWLNRLRSPNLLWIVNLDPRFQKSLIFNH